MKNKKDNTKEIVDIIKEVFPNAEVTVGYKKTKRMINKIKK